MQDSKHLDKALTYFKSLPGEEPYVRFGSRRYFDYQISKFLIEDVSVDWLQEGLALQTVNREVEDLLKEAYPEANPKSVFVKVFQEYLSDILGEPKTDYELVYPLNLSTWYTPPDRLTSQVGIERIDFREWQSYRKSAEEVELVSEFLTKHPNDFDDENFFYWRSKFSARDNIVPPNIVYDSVISALGQIEYCYKIRNLNPDEDPDGLPRDSWMELRGPPFLLVYKEDNFERGHTIDRNHRRPQTIPWPKEEPRTRYDSIPTLDHQSDYDRLLLDSFYAYHLGMAEPRRQTSFLYFWQGVERLTQTNRGDPTEEVLNRAEFVYDQIGGTIDPIFKDVLDEVGEKRNTFVHEGPGISVTQRFQEYTKLLLDGLITLYLECREDFSIQEMSDLLEYGPNDWKKAELVRKVAQMEFNYE